MVDEETRARWAASGAMALTGDRRGRPLVAPAAIVQRIEALGAPLGVDALALLGERAAIAGFGRRGTISCGGGTRLLRAADGWLVLSLARPDDIDLLAAWLGLDAPPLDPWPVVAAALAQAPGAEAVERGRLLGLPLGRLGEVAAPLVPVGRTRVGDADVLAEPPLVVDLSSLWAGPLCAQLLGDHGAQVVKVESTHRPDGARRGPREFFDLLHAGHRSVAVDFRTGEGRKQLRALLASADVVIEGSRPRALEQLGIVAEDLLADGPRVWVSITAHGRSGPGRDAVGFGDDAAAAGGLVAWAGDGQPRFVADAVADPLTGMAAAGAALDALASGGRWLLDVGLAPVAAWVAGADRRAKWIEGDDGEAHAPRARRPSGVAPELGADNAAIAEIA